MSHPYVVAPNQLLACSATLGVYEPCTVFIQPGDAQLLIQNQKIPQQRLDRMSAFLRCGVLDQWFRLDSAGSAASAEADAPCWKLPRAVLSAGVALACVVGAVITDTGMAFLPVDETRLSKLSFVYIVNGRNAMATAKVGLAYDLSEFATHAFHEVCNGYSIVFTAVVNRKDALRMFPSRGLTRNDSFRFKKVETLDELLQGTDERDPNGIKICC